ncbi:MAG: crosslink repair DNA glycosylase YcaQ family protein, partial [Sphingomonas sp.]
MSERLTAAQARRIALAAQGFGTRRPDMPGRAHVLRTLDRLGLFQIDSVNVISRAHYLPAFSRLGSYDRTLLDRAAWGVKRDRRMFEYWAHEASLLPLDLHPLLRGRMASADRGSFGWKAMRVFATERRAEAVGVVDRIRDQGPMAVSDFEEGRSRAGWWDWGDAKRILEWLFYAGHVTTATRRGGFERVYDLTERVIPRAILDLPTPDEAEAHQALIERGARALGVATATELRDYFRLKPAEGDPAIAALVEARRLIPVEVAG